MMERSEPALVPEWLRCTGSVTGGGSSTHHFVSSSLSSDVSSSFPTRNRCSRSSSDKDIQRSAYLDRSFSSNSRSNRDRNGSAKHPYSSFTRSNRDRNREKDKERFITADPWEHDSSDSLDSIPSSVEQNSLRRSQSLAPRRNVEVLSRKSEDSRNIATNQYNGNGLVLGGSNLSCFQKAAFDKDFPSLGTEEKLGGSSIGRVSSPVLSSAVQSLPIVNSGLLCGEKWTSALVEVPPTIGSNNNTTISSSTHQSSSSSVASASVVMAGLNMAEALSQAPPHARAAPQVPDKSQRLDELTMKQCLKLRPRAPTMPKPLIPSVLEKLKQPKAGARVNEPSFTSRSIQQSQSHQLSGQPRSGQVRSDIANTSHAGMYIIQKPRENGIISSAKDVSNPTNSANGKMANGQHVFAPLTPSAFTSPSNPKASTLEKKVAALNLNHKPVAEKKSTLSQAQSRNDFFNLVRQRTLLNSSPNAPESSPAVYICSSSEKSDENRKETDNAPSSTCVTEFNQMLTNGDSHGTYDKAQCFSDVEEKKMLNGEVFPDEEPDEEEVAFLRSLGWNENEEAEVITEEEIIAFYEEHNTRPSLKAFRGIQPKIARLSDSQSSHSVAVASSEPGGSTGSESEALIY